MDWRTKLRTVPDFPKPGILFYDITPVLQDPLALEQLVSEMEQIVRAQAVDHVIGIESRGFIFGALLAQRLRVGFVPVRKQGKLPHQTLRQSYALEYGEGVLEMHTDALSQNDRVVIIDDLLATGGTARAAAFLAEQAGTEVSGICCAIELAFLNGRKQLDNYDVFSLFSVER